MQTPEEMVAQIEIALSRLGAGGSQLRPQQKEVLLALAAKQNVFAALPTGYGKSLCYWAPVAAWGWTVWVVSPLISLIQDQALAAKELGLDVISWHGGLNAQAKDLLISQMEEGGAKLVFVSPERLVQWWDSGFLESLERLGLGPDLLALDEMHCFEEWRHFREGYQNVFSPIGRLEMRGVPILGLSASFSRKEADSWMGEFCAGYTFIGTSLGRENLRLNVCALESECERWLGLVACLRGLQAPETALVYCATRNEADEVARWLSSAGIDACAYHAGLPASLRSARTDAFRKGFLRVVCATSAFGMGVDYPRVGRVIHFSLPYSLESYWQEVGRGGRDGGPAVGVAFWLRSEIARARLMIEPAKKKYFELWEAWAKGECRKQSVARCLGQEEQPCGVCDRCRANGAFNSQKENIYQDGCPGWWPADSKDMAQDPWWIQPEAQLSAWAQEKIFGGGENS